MFGASNGIYEAAYSQDKVSLVPNYELGFEIKEEWLHSSTYSWAWYYSHFIIVYIIFTKIEH
jgi:hypothetical protein